MRLSAQAALLLMTAMSFSTAYAKSWQIVEAANKQCMLTTEHKEGSVVYRLEFLRLKGEDSPLEVQMRVKGKGATAHLFNLSNGSTVYLASTGAEGTANMFWNIPQDTAGIIAHFEGNQDLKLRPADGSRDQGIEFESTGFAKAKADFSKRCANNGPVLNADFERSFMRDSRRALSPTSLTATTVTELRSLFGQGYEAYKRVGANQAAINALRARFATQLNEANGLTTTISQLTNAELPRIQQQQVTNNSLDSQAQAELARLKVAIPQLNAAVASATSTRDRAEAAVAPLRAEQQVRESNAQNARAQATNAQARIGEIDRTINEYEGTIRQLEQEQDSAIARVRRAENDIRPARVEQRRAENDYSAWQPERELRERIQRNPRWHEAQRNLVPAQRAENDLEKLRDAAHDDKEIKEKAKEACQRTGGQDCTALAQAHYDALALYRRYEAEEDRAQAARNSIQSIITNIETIARNDVNAVTETLRSRLVAANQELANLNGIIDQGNGRATEISRYEIPRLNDQIGSLDRERPLQVNELNRMAPEAQRLENEQAAYERRVGWAAKTQTLETAQDKLDELQAQLGTANSGKVTAERNIAQYAGEKTRLSKLLGDKQGELARAQARLLVVNESLVPFNQENASLQAAATTLGGDLENLAAQFSAKIP